MMEMHYVYLLRSIPNPNQTYVGHTKDLNTRLQSHNHGQSPHTSKFKPWNPWSDQAKYPIILKKSLKKGRFLGLYAPFWG